MRSLYLMRREREELRLVSYAKEKIKASQGKRSGPSYAKEKIKALQVALQKPTRLVLCAAKLRILLAEQIFLVLFEKRSMRRKR